jgi:hypothetical protein
MTTRHWTLLAQEALEEFKRGAITERQLLMVLDVTLPTCSAKSGKHKCMLRPEHTGSSHRYWDSTTSLAWR